MKRDTTRISADNLAAAVRSAVAAETARIEEMGSTEIDSVAGGTADDPTLGMIPPPVGK